MGWLYFEDGHIKVGPPVPMPRDLPPGWIRVPEYDQCRVIARLVPAAAVVGVTADPMSETRCRVHVAYFGGSMKIEAMARAEDVAAACVEALEGSRG